MSEYLIKHGLNISLADHNGNTPLHFAAEAGERKWMYLIYLAKKYYTFN